MSTPALDQVSRYRLRFVGRGCDLLPVETGDVYRADEAWVRLSHAEHAARTDIAAAEKAAELAARADERRKCFEEMREQANARMRGQAAAVSQAMFSLSLWAAAKRDEGKAP